MLVSLLVRLLILPTTWTTHALRGRISRHRISCEKHSTMIFCPLYMSTQGKGDIGTTVVYEDDQSGTKRLRTQSQNTRETGEGCNVVEEEQRSSQRAVDLKFTSTLLTHYDNKLVYTLGDGTSLTLRRLQYLVSDVPTPYMTSFDFSL